MKHQSIVDPMIDSCKAAILEEGDCSNMAAFIDPDGKELGAVMYRHGNDNRLEQAAAFGLLARELGASDVIVIMDTWVTLLTPDAVTRPVVRPHDDPNRQEMLAIMCLVHGHDDIEYESLMYRRTGGSITWDDPKPAKDAGSPMVSAWLMGLSDTFPLDLTLIDILALLKDYGPFGFVGLDRETNLRVNEATKHVIDALTVNVGADTAEAERSIRKAWAKS